MKTNPGGVLAPDEVLGRDRLIEKLWQVLERQSLVLTAERRMGKTSIIRKMLAEPQPGMKVFFRDLEALRTPLEFVDSVYQDVQADLSRKGRTMSRLRTFMEQFGGLEVQGLKLPKQVAPHWKTILTKTMEDLAEQQDELLIFCWDEIPMMLDNIKREQSEAVAMEVLDTLRSLRQMIPTVRMVFTGSIGLHHVITRLKESGYANAPTNDMLTQDVAPLELTDACDLATRLLEGEQISAEDELGLAKAVAESVECLPYYIHHVIDELRWTKAAKTAERVNEIVQANLCDDSDRWDLAHYRERIDTYYTEPDRKLALGILDELAAIDTSLSLKELIDRLSVQGTAPDPEQVRKVLKLLARDHYLTKQADGSHRFKFELIRRYWRLR